MQNFDEVVFSKLSCYNKDTPTILAASKRPCQLNQVLQTQNAPASNRARRMGMVKKEGARYWCGKTKLRAGRNARKISTARTFDTIHKE